MFSQSGNFLEVYVSTRSDFLVKTSSRKQQHYHKRKHIRYFNTINMSSADAKIGCISEVSAINQSSSTQGRSFVNANVSVSSIFQNGRFFLKHHVLCHRSFPLKKNSVNCYLSIFNFNSPKY